MRVGAGVASGVAAAVYAGAAVLCFLAAGPHRAAWRAVALLLALLAVNRLLQLDLLAARLASHAAVRDGWYAGRRPVQLAAIVALGMAGLLGAGLVLFELRAGDAPLRVAAVAVLALGAFVLARAVSLHAVDAALEMGVGPLRIGRLIEGGLLAVVAAAAMVARSRNGGG